MEQVLLISNARAGSVSERAREVIVKALQADFKLDVAHTNHRDHATELAQDAVDRGFDAVVAFGGDGTVNETAQGLVATDVALGIIPGGTTNVMARTLGVPRDPIEATAFVGERLRSQSTRRIGVGRVNARYFLFCAGIGLDAEVVRRMEASPRAKRAGTEWRYLRHALNTAFTRYRGADPEIVVEVDDADPYRALLCVCANARPFTYFKNLPVDVCPQASLDKRLDMFALDRVSTLTIPRIAWGVLMSRAHVGWKHGHYHHDVPGASWRASRPMPVQVDGDYIGEWDRAVVRSVPDALSILA
ncbi:MAG: diacylglycerol kinase family lipid kinase [Actinomycetota bacterium]|nr:diacylglycerol kinase family lipid kinase [Actinomycetota bacterium]